MPAQSSEQVLERIKQEVDGLNADEQLRLASYLVDRARSMLPVVQMGRKWRDLRGLYTHPMVDEDAQAWGTRNREDADDQRKRS